MSTPWETHEGTAVRTTGTRPPAGAVDAAIEAAGVSVRRGGRDVVRDVTVSVPAGTVTGLLGPSGCGKSTLIRAIVGVQAGVRGRLTVLGERAGARTLRRRVAYVTQAPSVYQDLTVVENLRYFAALLGHAGADGAQEVADALATVDLEDHAHAVAGRLSGGERARVSLATALLGTPELLLLDEPTVGLDPVLRRDLWGTFRRLADAGATLLVSSHVMDEADRCDGVIILRDGTVLAHDSPAGLRATTHEERLEDAFLALVEHAGGDRAPGDRAGDDRAVVA
jgi:ABC-2 type transport system ATP-binding protein